jgi:thioredoxin-related protein
MDRRLTGCFLVTSVAVFLGITATSWGAAPSWFKNPFHRHDVSSSRETTSGQLAQAPKRVPPAKPGPTKRSSAAASNGHPVKTLAVATTDALSSAPAKIHWQSDLREARAISLRENRPLLVMFSADWCTFCHKLERQALSDPELVAYVNARFIPVKLDVEEHKRIAAILEVESLPATVILSPKADLLGTITGYFEKSEFQASLKDALALDKKLHQTAATSAQ